jgi:hypothetical protein
MTLKWIDGCEGWQDATYATRAYADTGSVSTATPGRVSPGTRAWSLNGGRMQTPSLGVQNTWVIGLGLFFSQVAAGFKVRFFSGGSEQCRFEIENSGGLPRFKLVRGTTTIATGSTFALSQWFYFEFKVTVRTGTNGAYELRQNEVNVLSGSSVNLADTGADGADQFGWGYHTGGNTVRVDDIYILDDQGTVNNNFKGDSVAVHILPSAEGHQIDFTPSTGTNNAANVDDGAASGADYNSSDTNAHEDYYTFEDLPPTGLGTIHGIRASGSWAMATTGSRVARYRYYNGSTEVTIGSNVSAASTTVVELPQVVEVNPNTGVNWTKSEIDAAEFGVEVVS